MLKFYFVMALAATSLASCATTSQPLMVETQSGRPEAIFLDTSIDQARGKIASRCMDAAMIVTQSSSSEVICESNLSMGQSVLAQVAIGNSYSTTPRQYVKVVMAEVGNNVRLQASSWIETQMAFGQVRRAPTDTSNSQKNDLQGFILSAGAVLPDGARLGEPKPTMGIRVHEKEIENSHSELYVAFVTNSSPAEKAGLRVCDQISAINGEKISTSNDMQNFKVEADKAVTFTVKRGDVISEVIVYPEMKQSVSDLAEDELAQKNIERGC
jgi:hypothetical protein